MTTRVLTSIIVFALAGLCVISVAADDIGVVIGPFANEETTLRENYAFIPYPAEHRTLLADGTGPIGGVFFHSRGPDRHLGAYIDIAFSRANLEFYDELNDEFVENQTRIVYSHGELNFFPVRGGPIYLGAGTTFMFITAWNPEFVEDQIPEWQSYQTTVTLPHISVGASFSYQRFVLGLRIVRKMLSFDPFQPSGEAMITLGYRLE